MTENRVPVYSPLQKERLKYQPKTQPLIGTYEPLIFENGEELQTKGKEEDIKKIFPTAFSKLPLEIKSTTKDKTILDKILKNLKENKNNSINVGVALSGGQAAGGHNVIIGIYDYLDKSISKLNSTLKKEDHVKFNVYGFIKGVEGLLANKTIKLTAEFVNLFRNQGGFHMIDTSRRKIESKEDYANCLKTCKALSLNTVVIIGGDDSNTNACLLSEYFAQNLKEGKIQVFGCPKTIDGDLRGNGIEMSFGFDTCTKEYASLIGNLMIDVKSGEKYYAFVRLMGRDASHLCVETALRTQPNYVFIGEEVKELKLTLKEVVQKLVDIVKERSSKLQNGKNYGLFIIPEGIINFIKDVAELIDELKKIDTHDINSNEERAEFIKKSLTKSSLDCLNFLPDFYKSQILFSGYDSHGNIQLSQIESERFISELVKRELLKDNIKIETLVHFFGYEGRSGLPSNFDCDYCYTIGATVSAFLLWEYNNPSGYIIRVRNLKESPEKWKIGAIPLTTMMHIEFRRHIGEDGKKVVKPVPVIKKFLVNTDQKSFKELKSKREEWKLKSDYLSPGPIQFGGSTSDEKPVTLVLDF